MSLYKDLPQTRQRSVPETDGSARHLLEPSYHSNPVSEKGSLVTVDHALDIVHHIYRASGMITTVHLEKDDRYGLDAEFLEVLVSVKV